MKCACKNCANEAAWQPIVSFWAIGRPKTARTSINVTGPLSVCTVCKDRIVPEDIVSDAAFEKIAAAVTALGKSQPDRDSGELHFNPIN